jgi:hypothetical protein
MTEDDLVEQGRRRVTEGMQRIHRQSDLVSKLRRHGHWRLLPLAERLLGHMLRTQRAFEDHLEVVETAARSDHTS